MDYSNSVFMEDELMEVDLRTPAFIIESGITKEDVWGRFDSDLNQITSGMVIAKAKDICPVYGTELPYKSVVVKCKIEEYNAVKYWLEYVHGAECIRGISCDDDETMTIRSEYQCW